MKIYGGKQTRHDLDDKGGVPSCRPSLPRHTVVPDLNTDGAVSPRGVTSMCRMWMTPRGVTSMCRMWMTRALSLLFAVSHRCALCSRQGHHSSSWRHTFVRDLDDEGAVNSEPFCIDHLDWIDQDARLMGTRTRCQ